MDPMKLAAKLAAFAFYAAVVAGALLLLSGSVMYVSAKWTNSINKSRDITMQREVMRARQMSAVLGGPENFIQYEKAHAADK